MWWYAAAARVKQMNAGANKFHSFNAAVGAGLWYVYIYVLSLHLFHGNCGYVK